MGGRCGRYVNIYQKEFVSWHSAQFHAIKYVLKKLKSHGPCAEVIYNPSFSSIQFSSVAQSCPTICNPMDCSTPGFPIHHQLPELAQTHIYRVGDAIQPLFLIMLYGILHVSHVDIGAHIFLHEYRILYYTQRKI